MLILLIAARSFSTTDARTGRTATAFPEAENKELASILLCSADILHSRQHACIGVTSSLCLGVKCVPVQIVFSGPSVVEKLRAALGKMSTAGVLRLRATGAVSRE